jgi:hypothetical protein
MPLQQSSHLFEQPFGLPKISLHPLHNAHHALGVIEEVRKRHPLPFDGPEKQMLNADPHTLVHAEGQRRVEENEAAAH